jgi:hypothetical protein
MGGALPAGQRRFPHIFSLYHIFAPKVNRQVAQRFSRKFGHFFTIKKSAHFLCILTLLFLKIFDIIIMSKGKSSSGATALDNAY